jgi:hypothetical protein
VPGPVSVHSEVLTSVVSLKSLTLTHTHFHSRQLFLYFGGCCIKMCFFILLIIV